jgi:hypothetical protein
MLDAAALPPLRVGERRSNLGAAGLAHQLVVRIGERRETLRPGDWVDLDRGRLRYLGLNTWMGYRLVYDVAVYWMAAAVAVVIGSMVWFYARSLLSRADGQGVAA